MLWVVCAPVGPAFAAVQNFSELCRTGTAEEVRQALSEGADPNASDEKEKLPLFEALLNPDLKVLQTLIEAGADVKRRNSPLYPGDIGGTPLHNAVLNLCDNRERPGRIRMSPEVLRILLDVGADVNADSSLGTPLYQILIFYDCNPKTVDFLISEGADVNFRDSDDETPLMRAAETGTCPEIVRLLLDAGADVNAQRKDGWTPLMLAVLSGIDVFRSHPDAEHNISLLLEAGADPNIMAKGDEVGPSFTALSVSAWGNDRKAAKLLLEAGADPDLKDSHGYTAFARASRMLSGDVADLLLFGGSAPLRAVF